MSAVFRAKRLYRSCMQYARNLDGSYSLSQFTIRDHRPLLRKGKKP